MEPRTLIGTLPDPGLVVAIADAHAASDAAARIAADSTHWATRADAGSDDAAEVVNCAMRARQIAERSVHCASAAEAWACAREAWGAVSSALEASARVNAAIADLLAAL